MTWYRLARLFCWLVLPVVAVIGGAELRAGFVAAGLLWLAWCAGMVAAAAHCTDQIRAGNGSANRVSLVTAQAWLWCSLAGKAHRRAFRAALERQGLD